MQDPLTFRFGCYTLDEFMKHEYKSYFQKEIEESASKVYEKYGVCPISKLPYNRYPTIDYPRALDHKIYKRNPTLAIANNLKGLLNVYPNTGKFVRDTLGYVTQLEDRLRTLMETFEVHYSFVEPNDYSHMHEAIGILHDPLSQEFLKNSPVYYIQEYFESLCEMKGGIDLIIEVLKDYGNKIATYQSMVEMQLKNRNNLGKIRYW